MANSPLSRSAEIWQLVDTRGQGGIESHVSILAQGLNNYGLPVRVVRLRDHGHHSGIAALKAKGVECSTLDGGFWGLIQGLRRSRPALVHTHGYKAGILGRLACRLLGVPVVSSFHAGEPGAGRVRLYNGLDRLTAHLAPAIAVSEAIADRIPGAQLVENFVAMPPEDARSLRPSTIAFVGRLSHEKGPDLFCETVAPLHDLDAVVFGDGPMGADLRMRGSGQIRFRGMVPDMAPYWRDIGLLVMTSRHEGLPMAALEAMAHGVPVAAFAVGGLPRLIDHGTNGWLVPAGDTGSMTNILRVWLDMDPLWKGAFSDSARRKVRTQYSLQSRLPGIAAIYAAAGLAWSLPMLRQSVLRAA